MRERWALEALIGAYVAMVATPAAALSGWLPALRVTRLPALAAAGVVVTVAAAAAARRIDDVAGAAATLPVAVASILPPLAYLPYMVLATTPESAAALVAAVGLLAVLPGIGVPVVGAVLRSRRVREAATEVAVVTVGETDDEGRDWPVLAGVTVLAAAFVAVAAFVATTGDDGFEAVWPAFGGVSTTLLLLFGDDGSEVAVTDRGLRVDRAVTSWDDIDGYRVTDERIELVRSAWYLPARGFERERISDEDALLDGLGEFLPRLDRHGRVEARARR
jgi:hypothetical protein